MRILTVFTRACTTTSSICLRFGFSTPHERDVVTAFSFTPVTYMLMGTMFFIVFPVNKLCISDVSLCLPARFHRISIVYALVHFIYVHALHWSAPDLPKKCNNHSTTVVM